MKPSFKKLVEAEKAARAEDPSQWSVMKTRELGFGSLAATQIAQARNALPVLLEIAKRSSIFVQAVNAGFIAVRTEGDCEDAVWQDFLNAIYSFDWSDVDG